MRDLHVLTVAEDGTRLVLADSGGEQYSLPLDERLLATLRTESRRPRTSTSARTVALSPREIQAQVRAGASPDEVASTAGVALDRVMRFAAPVLDERAHMARRARGVLLRNESMLELGTLDEVVTGALVARSVDDTVTWDAWRRDDGRWIVSCSWQQDGDKRVARWVLDASAGSATPMDDDARVLAGLPTQAEADADTRGPSRGPSRGQARRPARLAVVPNPQGADTSHPGGAEGSGDGAGEATGEATGEAPGRAGDATGGHVAQDDTPTGPIPTVTDTGSSGTPGPTHPARRARRQQHADDAERLPLSELATTIEVEERRPSRPARDTGGRQRPAVPSWDEIMFGRRT